VSFQSTSTLQQPDDVSAAAAASSGSLGGGGGGGTGIEVIQLDASGGNVTETLPTPSTGQQVFYIRTDDNSGATATIEDPNGNDILILGLPNEPFYEVPPHGTVFLVSDGESWYVENFDRGLRSISGFAPGQPSPQFPLMRQKIAKTVLLQGVFYDAKSSPSGTVSLSAQKEGSPTFSSVSMSSEGASDNSFEVVLKEGDVLLVTIDQFDEALRDLSVTFI